MVAALILAVGALLAAGLVFAGAPFLTARMGLHPIMAAKLALAAGSAAATVAGGVAWVWLRG